MKSAKGDPLVAKNELRAAGMRSTAPRIAVLELLRTAGKPMSHADVADELAPRGFDRASVYRNLMDLTEAGLVGRRDFGDHIWRFEYRSGEGGDEKKAHATEHAHFVCDDCGNITCLPGAKIKLPKAIAKRGVAVEVKGICARCE